MGYNKSLKALEAVRPILDIVLAVNNQKVSVPSEFPTKLAMSIREGCKSAADIGGEYQKYGDILTTFRIRVKQDKIVFDPRSMITYSNPVIELAQALKTLEIPKVNNVLQVVGACIKHKNAPCISFPDADLPTEEMATLEKWAIKNDYTIQTSPLTLFKNESGTGTGHTADSGSEASIAQ